MALDLLFLGFPAGTLGSFSSPCATMGSAFYGGKPAGLLLSWVVSIHRAQRWIKIGLIRCLNAGTALGQCISTWVPSGFFKCTLAKCLKIASGISLLFSSTKPQVFIVHHDNLLASGTLTTNNVTHNV